MRRTRVRTVLAVLFGLFTLEAWAEVLLATLGGSDSPRALTALQTAVGVAGVFATRGIWTGARWAPAAAVVYGAITGGMLVALPLILGLGPKPAGDLGWRSRRRALSLGVAWYLRRAVRGDACASSTQRRLGPREA
jgi:hypothetical protein